jgi:cytochrome c oxidase accessory protein FixG
MLDLTDRIIQTPTLARAANGNLKWHAPRRLLQVLCGVLLVALPFTNGLRLDLRRDEFYFAWHKMAAHDLFLLFWVSMLGTALLSAVSFLYGRLWCGWVCPQTLASDFADSLKTRLDKVFGTRPGKPRFWLSRSVWTFGILAVSLGTGITLAAYWLAPRTVFAATLAPWRDYSAGLTVYLTALVVAADMLWLRRKFCSHACPYGPLLSSLTDQNTLVVRYLTERDDECIQCHKCEVDCPMDIDIKQGVGQHGCIGCGECVDACNDVLGKRGKAGLIEFRYGMAPERITQALTPTERLGLWDARRWGVAATVPLCLVVVLFLIYGSLPTTASVNANGAIARTAQAVSNGYGLTLTNGAPQSAPFAVTVQGLPGGSVQPSVITVPGHESVTVPITIVTTAHSVKPGRTPIRLRVTAGRTSELVQTIFYTP